MPRRKNPPESKFRKALRRCCGYEGFARQQMIEKLMKLAETFDDWYNVLIRTEEGGAYEVLAWSKLEEKAVTFGNRLKMWHWAKAGSSEETKVLADLMDLAQNPVDVEAKKRKGIKFSRLLLVASLCPKGSLMEGLAHNAIMDQIIGKKAEKPTRQEQRL